MTDLIIQSMEEAGFSVSKSEVRWTIRKSKEEAVNYIRNRSVSSWEQLTDAEIEEGVAEVLARPGDVVEVKSEKEIIVAVK